MHFIEKEKQQQTRNYILITKTYSLELHSL